MRRFFRNNGLSLVLMGLFALSAVGQIAAGFRDENNRRRDWKEPPLTLRQYVASGSMWEAFGENWESEFLQMGMYVLLTALLFQKGSAESKDPDGGPEDVDQDPAEARNNPHAPWPVRRGGWIGRVYRYSLSLAFFLLFALSVWVHAAGGVRAYNEEQARFGHAPLNTPAYLGTARFWFESFENWQSEFLSLVAMVVLSIFLRQKGSPESKPVATPHLAHAG